MACSPNLRDMLCDADSESDGEFSPLLPLAGSTPPSLRRPLSPQATPFFPSQTVGRTKELCWQDSPPQSDNSAASSGRRSFRDVVLDKGKAPASAATSEPRPPSSSPAQGKTTGLMADARRPPRLRGQRPHRGHGYEHRQNYGKPKVSSIVVSGSLPYLPRDATGGRVVSNRPPQATHSSPRRRWRTDGWWSNARDVAHQAPGSHTMVAAAGT